MLDPRIAPPLGLLYIIAWARHHGWDTSGWHMVDHAVTCLQPDAPVGHGSHDFSLERCMRDIPSGADIYGLQLASMQVAHGRAIARALRVRDPQAVIVFGGSHASAVPLECADPVVMRGGHADYVVTREGEKAFCGLLDRFVAGDLPRRPNGGEIVTGEAVDPLDLLPFPARDLIDIENDYTRRITGRVATNAMISRSCPARCSYCQMTSLWGDGPLRMHSPERLLAEVDDIRVNAPSLGGVLFVDDSLTARKRSDMVTVAEGMSQRDLLWRGWTRANLLTRKGDNDMLRAMSQNGCTAICIGVESGSDRVLKAIGKGTTVDINRRAIRAVAESGIDCRVSIMVGNPSETWDDVYALIDFVAEMSPWVSDWILSSYVPLPGTPSWENPENYGLVIDKKKARDTGYSHFYVVGGNEQSGMVHSYADGTGPTDIQRRHDAVQETLLRRAPRERRRVTIGDITPAQAAK